MRRKLAQQHVLEARLADVALNAADADDDAIGARRRQPTDRLRGGDFQRRVVKGQTERRDTLANEVGEHAALLAVALQIVCRETGEHEAQSLSFALDQRIRALGRRIAYVISAEQQLE